MQKCNTACAVWIVFNGNNFCSDCIFVALEVDNAVLLLVATTAVTSSLATI